MIIVWSLVVRDSSKLLRGPRFGGHQSHICTRLVLTISGALGRPEFWASQEPGFDACDLLEARETVQGFPKQFECSY